MTKLGYRKELVGLLAVLALMAAFFIGQNTREPALADSGDNIIGFAWSENIGWLSFNCDSQELSTPRCSNSDYGVRFHPFTGLMSGHAWSPFVGWVSFTSGDLVGCPQSPCQATLDVGTGVVSGWAKVLSYNGWLSLSCASTTDNCSSSSYNVTYDDATDEFSGWAWEPDIIGWLSFNCNNPESGDICITSNSYGGPSAYKVSLRPPVGNTPVADFDFCTDGGNTVNFYDMSYDPDGTVTDWWWLFGDTNETFEQHPEHSYTVATDYNVELRVLDNMANQSSVTQTVNPNTAPSCNFSLAAWAGSCAAVSLSWNWAAGADIYNVYRGGLQIASLDAQNPLFCNGVSCAWDDGSVIASTDYSYTVEVVRMDGSSRFNSNGVQSVRTPQCPVTGTNTEQICGQITISWDDGLGPPYRVCRSLQAEAGFEEISSGIDGDPGIGNSNCTPTNPGQRCYQDTEIVTGTDYYYGLHYMETECDEIPLLVIPARSRCFRSPSYIEL
jgi:hypothetical protein